MKNQPGKTVKQKEMAAGGTGSLETNQVGKNVEQKAMVPKVTSSIAKNQVGKLVKQQFAYEMLSSTTYTLYYTDPKSICKTRNIKIRHNK